MGLRLFNWMQAERVGYFGVNGFWGEVGLE